VHKLTPRCCYDVHALCSEYKQNVKIKTTIIIITRLSRVLFAFRARKYFPTIVRVNTIVRRFRVNVSLTTYIIVMGIVDVYTHDKWFVFYIIIIILIYCRGE